MWFHLFTARLNIPRRQIIAEADSVDTAFSRYLDGDVPQIVGTGTDTDAALRLILPRDINTQVLQYLQGRLRADSRTRAPTLTPRRFLRAWLTDAVATLRTDSPPPAAIVMFDTVPTHITHMCTTILDGHTAYYKQVYPANSNPAPIPRILNHVTAPARPYHCDANPQWKTTCHYGQRKLFMSEIEFLCHHAQHGDTVVYAGAAPGTHITLLREMFASLNLTFILVDPAFTDADAARSTSQCVIVRDLFHAEGTEPNCAAAYRTTPNVLFVSDIRCNTSTDGHAPSQDDVDRDMALQQECVRAMAPRAGMLKFRLPWRRVTVPYIRGDLHLPVWGGQRTTECRLIFTREQAFAPDGTLNMTLYDAQRYENQMYFFNTNTRVSRHPGTAAGTCQCYDCAAETAILAEYTTRFPQDGLTPDTWRARITDDNPEQDPAMCAGETHAIMMQRRRL